MKLTPEETPLETPLNRFIFWEQSSRGTQRNKSIEPNDTARSFLILQNHSCQKFTNLFAGEVLCCTLKPVQFMKLCQKASASFYCKKSRPVQTSFQHTAN